jgi:hypothetical protein
MSATIKMEWNEPGVGVCYVWQESANSWGYSTTGIWGHALTLEEAKAELEAFIAEKGGK